MVKADEEFIKKLILDKIDTMASPEIGDYMFIREAIGSAIRLGLGKVFVNTLKKKINYITGDD